MWLLPMWFMNTSSPNLSVSLLHSSVVLLGMDAFFYSRRGIVTVTLRLNDYVFLKERFQYL